ncbi:chromosome segregation protein SMC [Candidatus Woesearchaeota archaeon]|nr:chromosome segregation protein SMC [Candidatus Woesearchaeota archaeon]
MTTIKKIHIHGFKSFAKPIEIPLEKDFSTFIGPNGAGKTNVSDSICFVLGRLSSKSMRVEKASHLIYNGGKKNKPANKADVSIFFDNSDKKFPIKSGEVKISRIVNQNGNSIYKINDEVRTRQQVLELLGVAKIDPDGHNIVQQGDITKFMEMKTEDRREVIEEIAGISVYEDKKQKAMQELEKVQQKLTEADIILTEREANLRELKKDRDQAKKYKELEYKIKDNKATYLTTITKEKQEKITDLEKSLSDLQTKVTNFSNKINEYREKIQRNRNEIRNINIEIEEKGEKEQIILRKDIDDLKTSIIRTSSRIETLQSEIKKIDERKSQLKLNIQENEEEIKKIKLKKKEFEDQIKNLNNEESSILKEISSFKEKHNIQNLDDYKNKINSIEEKIESYSQLLLKLQDEKQELIRNKDKTEFQLQNIDQQFNKIKNLESENKEKSSNLEKFRQDFKRITVELSKSLNEDSAFSAQLSKARHSLIENNEELARLRARHIGIKEHLSQDFAVKKILALKQKGVYGTVAELGTVSSKFSLALEVAAGPRINSIVVENDEIAAKCIKILKESKSGIATFLPLNKIKPRVTEDLSRLPKEGNYGHAISLIKFDPKFKDVFSYVFGGTLVIEGIETARKIGIGRVRMVSLEGDLLETSGAMIGGFRQRSSHGVGFSQDEVNKKILELENEASRLTSIVSTLETKKLENEEKIINLRQNKANLEAEIIKTEKTLGISEDPSELKKQQSSLLQQKKEFDLRIKETIAKVESFFKETDKLKRDKESLTSKITHDPEINKSLVILEEKRTLTREKLLEIKNEITNLNNQIERIYLPEIEKTNKIIKNQEKEYEQFKTELNDLSTITKNKESELKEKNKLEKESYGKFKDLSIKRNKLSEEIQKLETFIIEEQEKSKSQELKINELNIKRASLVAELEALNKEFEQYKDGKIRRGISIDELKSEIKEFEKLISNLGTVNLRALEIYDQLEKEHQELTEKSSKLKLEKDDVLNLINEIESKKKDIFLKTFNEINKKFQEIFASLSTKGEAYLELEDKEDPLKAGIDIKVRIVGNKFLDIKSLSGGEKTLTALSFIFSIQEYEPASFYLLDEVDAALDKTNSELLSKLIAKYSNKAQYIVISHNDTIINEANQIYGVSMQDGISKIISLKI